MAEQELLPQDLKAIRVERASPTVTDFSSLSVSCLPVRFVIVFLTF